MAVEDIDTVKVLNSGGGGYGGEFALSYTATLVKQDATRGEDGVVIELEEKKARIASVRVASGRVVVRANKVCGVSFLLGLSGSLAASAAQVQEGSFVGYDVSVVDGSSCGVASCGAVPCAGNGGVDDHVDDVVHVGNKVVDDNVENNLMRMTESLEEENVCRYRRTSVRKSSRSSVASAGLLLIEEVRDIYNWCRKVGLSLVIVVLMGER